MPSDDVTCVKSNRACAINHRQESFVLQTWRHVPVAPFDSRSVQLRCLSLLPFIVIEGLMNQRISAMRTSCVHRILNSFTANNSGSRRLAFVSQTSWPPTSSTEWVWTRAVTFRWKHTKQLFWQWLYSRLRWPARVNAQFQVDAIPSFQVCCNNTERLIERELHIKSGKSIAKEYEEELGVKKHTCWSLAYSAYEILFKCPLNVYT